MKKTLLAMTLGALLSGNAAAETYDFSYVSTLDNYLGINAAETYDVAIELPGDLFEGYAIKNIKANVNASAGVSCYSYSSLWLSGSLALSGSTFTPTVANYEVKLGNNGVLTTDLEDAYVIPAEGVYVGYTLTVARLNTASGYPMGFGDGCTDPGAFYCRTSKTMTDWSDLAASMEVGAAISVTLEKANVPTESVQFTYAPGEIFLIQGEGWKGTLGFASFASEPVSSVDLEYAIEGTPKNVHYDLPKYVPAGLNQKFEMPIELDAIDHEMIENLTFKVARVNGQPNQSEKGEKTSKLVVRSEYPSHQTLIEEYTGTWCPWCTRGYAALEYIKHNEPEFVVAAFHNADPMQVTTDYPFSPAGFPYASLNREIGGDPYWMTGAENSGFNLVDDVKALNAENTPWGIEVTHTWDYPDILVAQADVWNVAGYEDGGYEIAYLLVADGLSGKSSSWAQKNNYASYNQSASNIPELNAFCRGGDYGKSLVPGLEFNDVVISTNGIYGVEGSLPEALAFNQKTSHTLSFDLSKISKTLIPDRSKLRVIAAVVDSKGVVRNCAKNEVNDYYPNAVDGIEEANDAPVEYYNLNGVKVSEPTPGIYIRRQGAKSEKIVIR